MQEMADRNPMLDGRPTLEILREVRATDDSAPPYRREGSE
jgi:hypothetical protein